MTGRRKLLQRVAERLKAIGDPTRLEILHTLEGREMCVGDVLARVGGSQANISKHLAVLRRSGIVEARREGLHVFYRTTDDSVFTICVCVRDALTRQLASESRAIAPAPRKVPRTHDRGQAKNVRTRPRASRSNSGRTK
jgi:DNA-binding transcriptional ArsR family regulator